MKEITGNTSYRESGYSVGDIVPDYLRAEFDKLAEKTKLFDRPDLKVKEVNALADQATDNYRREHGLSGTEIFESNIRVWRGPENERLAPDTVKVTLRSDTLATFLAATKEINAGKAGPLPINTVLTTGNLLQWAVHEKTPAQLVWDYNTYQKPSAEPPQVRVLELSPQAQVVVMDGHDRLSKDGRTGITGEQLISASLSTFTKESLVASYDRYLESQREWNPKRFGLEPKAAEVSRDVPGKQMETARGPALETASVNGSELPPPLPLPLTKDEIKAITAKRLDALGTPDQVTAQFRDYKLGKSAVVTRFEGLTTGDLIEQIKFTEARLIQTLPTEKRKEQEENKLSAYLDALSKGKLIEEAILSDLRLKHFSADKYAALDSPAEKEAKKKEQEKPLSFAERIKAKVQGILKEVNPSRPAPSRGQELER